MLIEAGIALVVVVLVLIFVEASPYLASSGQTTSIGVYNERKFGAGNVTITRGYIINTPKFDYPTFDPAILVLDLNFQNWANTGNLTISINGKVFGTFFASPQNPHVRLTAVSFSGTDLVEPSSKYSPILGNTIYFSSNREGYEGTFSYQIGIRGSR
jgi:hypothetical protein